MSSKRITLFLSTVLLFGTATAYPQITPSGITLGPSQQQQFSASGQQQWSWSIVPTGIGTITATGLYTAPAAYQSSYVYIYARSGSMYNQTEVHLSQGPVTSAGTAQPVGISVSPASIYLYGGQSTQFTASVSNINNTQVMWSITQGVGSIVNGLYTAPSSVSSDSLVTILATSVADPTKSASATILLGPAIAPAVTTPPPSNVSITLKPRSTSLKASQSKQLNATVSGSSNTAVTWSLNPNVGTVSNGFYTAPATISATQVVQITATSVADTTKSASSNITLNASVAAAPPPPPPPPPTSVSPATTTVAPGGTGQFSVQNLPSGVTVAWGVSPAVGSIASSGLYTAPSPVTAPQILTVTATNASTQAVLGTASLTLTATPPPPSVTPATATIAPSGTQQFTMQNLPSSVTVAWSVSPTTGSIASTGLYTAPSTVATQQTLTVTATNSSTQVVLGTASLTVTATPPPPSVSPATATVAPSGTQQFSVQNLSSGTKVTWSISPATGSISTSGLYSAPSTVATQTAVTVTAKNSSTKAVLGAAIVTLTASPAPPPVTSITLPIEVVGPDGTTSTTSFTIPPGANLSGQLQLWMQIHNLKYDTEASVQVNNSAWLPLSTNNVTLLGNAAAFGGIGGGFHTLQMTINLPSGVVTTGNNTVTFRFNGTDGAVSGFRVLAFNIQSGGSNLLSSALFVEDDPSTWVPPSTAPSDIAAGLALYQGASLTAPGVGAIQAHCSDCHSIDGRDLKYFNYSNNSIEARSLFHGLTAQQGSQIASYIRSLNIPNPGRPWNPPYQPGPGLDSQPVENWSAGAGLDAVLDNDSEMQQYLMPGGSTAGFAATSYLNPREMPIVMQLLDWNAWLPKIHPKDAFGPSFTNGAINADYLGLRAALQPNNPTAYTNARYSFDNWFEAAGTFLAPVEANANWSANNLPTKVYSVTQWMMVKQWELNQEFGLEGMPQAIFGARSDVRSWVGSEAFDTAPDMQHIPVGPSIGNGSQVAYDYVVFAWTQLQLVLNDGQGGQGGHTPIDYGYAFGSLHNLYVNDAKLPGIMLQVEWLVKSLQEFTLSGNGPQVGDLGWAPFITSPLPLVNFNYAPLWSATSPATRATISQAYTQAWFNQASTYTPQQFYLGHWTTATENPATDLFDTTFAGGVWYMLPRLRFVGVSVSLTDQIGTWAATIWPVGNWTLNNSATCTSIFTCTSGY